MLGDPIQASEGPAPAVDPSLLLPQIIAHCLCEGDAADLAPDPQFMHARFRCHQIFRLLEFASKERNNTFTKNAVARAFGVDRSVVMRACQRGYGDLRRVEDIMNSQLIKNM
jgi:hypothetical protein